MGTRESTTVEKSEQDPSPRPSDRRIIRILAGGPPSTQPEHFINLFCGQGYVPRRPLTSIGGDISVHSVNIDEEMVRLQIWDRSFEERFHNISLAPVKGRHVGFMVMYDVRDKCSFERAKELITADIPNKVDPEMPVVLVSCQCQQKEMRQVSYYTAREFADERGIPVVEVCGKEGVNVELAFMTLVGEILSKYPFV